MTKDENITRIKALAALEEARDKLNEGIERLMTGEEPGEAGEPDQKER